MHLQQKVFAGSRIFRYGLRNDILSRGQKNQGGGEGPPPPMVYGVNGKDNIIVLIQD